MPHPVDKHVGRQLEKRRLQLNMTHSDVARQLNTTFDQVQKYETASNRISASKLHQLAKLLDVPHGYFFEGIVD